MVSPRLQIDGTFEHENEAEKPFPLRGDNFLLVNTHPVRLDGMFISCDGEWYEVAKVEPGEPVEWGAAQSERWEVTDG